MYFSILFLSSGTLNYAFILIHTKLVLQLDFVDEFCPCFHSYRIW